MLGKDATNKNERHEHERSSKGVIPIRVLKCAFSQSIAVPEFDTTSDSSTLSECFSDTDSCDSDRTRRLEWDACSNDGLDLYHEAKAAEHLSLMHDAQIGSAVNVSAMYPRDWATTLALYNGLKQSMEVAKSIWADQAHTLIVKGLPAM